jgi:hypothetical protein
MPDKLMMILACLDGRIQQMSVMVVIVSVATINTRCLTIFSL